MNPEIKKLWIDALKSNLYNQGTCKLRAANNQYCCLGVLCDLYAKNTRTEFLWELEKDHGGYSFEGNMATLPERVREWSGINSTNASYINQGAEDNLMQKNDHGASFDKIAAIIELYF